MKNEQNKQEFQEEESIDSVISTVPSALDINDPDVIKAGNYYLPYSTGFEIECVNSELFNETDFINIPNIVEVKIDADEKRFRIPSGIHGLVCLEQISKLLYTHCLFTESGIHYHIDCTDMFTLITDKVIEDNKDWILKRLDFWEYKGTYNSRDMHRNRCWVRVHNGYKTLEIRIGEMTFAYPKLFERITDANDIVRTFKYKIEAENLRTNSPILRYVEDSELDAFLTNRKIKI